MKNQQSALMKSNSTVTSQFWVPSHSIPATPIPIPVESTGLPPSPSPCTPQLQCCCCSENWTQCTAYDALKLLTGWHEGIKLVQNKSVTFQLSQVFPGKELHWDRNLSPFPTVPQYLSPSLPHPHYTIPSPPHSHMSPSPFMPPLLWTHPCPLSRLW